MAGVKKVEGPKKRFFWDIESYNNLFIVGLLNQDDILEMHYLINDDDEDALNDIKRALHDSIYETKLYNLAENASVLQDHFRIQIPRPAEKTLMSNFLGESDKEVLPKEDWYFGYNTIGYDIPMIDHLLDTVVAGRAQTTPTSMRDFSSRLIEDNARVNRKKIDQYLQYANQVDCAYLNEKMVDKGHPTIGLKTLVGIKGGSIIESESNKSGFSEDIYQDVVYNINDIVELRDVVFPGVMESTFNNRESLLNTFDSLKKHGITVNSTSAKFVEYIVSPDGPIDDYETASFMYPAPHIAKELGVPQTDVLDDTYEWYMKNVFEIVNKTNPESAKRNALKFGSIMAFYSDVRGKNWNSSAHYKKLYGDKYPAHTNADRKKLTQKYGTYLPLIHADGSDSGTYLNFSVGGIHGAEYNSKQLEDDRKAIKFVRDNYKYISQIPKKTISKKLMNLITKQSRTQYVDPATGQKFPQFMSHEVPYMYRATEPVDEILPPEEFTPFMYEKTAQKDSEGLISRYKFTSAEETIHQDFDGYYVKLLINFGAFYDGHGKDVYNEIYQFRLNLKAQLKGLDVNSDEFRLKNIEQNGYKLVLNSASGVLDGNFDTNLRANNKAMSMRSTGQLITARIAFTLAMGGADIISSNTDGIYASHIPYEENKRLVDAELDRLYVGITPEPVYLVSKDANNRMELEDGEITSARGATLTSWQGADVANRLSHPALSDKVTTKYLEDDSVLNGKVNTEWLKKCLDNYSANPDVLSAFKHYPDAVKRTFVYMASWVIRSTSGSILVTDDGQVYPGTVRAWLTKTGQSVERFVTKSAKPSKSLNAFAELSFPDQKLGDPEIISHLTEVGAYPKYFEGATTVQEYLDQMAENPNSKTSVQVVAKSKISGMPAHGKIYINNASILKMSEAEVDAIYQQLDMEAYTDLIAGFAEAWQNVEEPSLVKA